MESSRRIRYQPPISPEGERRKIMISIHGIEKGMRQFWERWLKYAKDDFIEEWLDCINRIYLRFGLKRPAKDCDEFYSYLKECKEDQEFSHRPECTQLEQICERSREFNELILTARMRIHHAVENQLAKYCLSFIAEADDLDISSVTEFENSINKWREKIYQGFARIDSDLREMEHLSDTFNSYVQNYGKVLHFMELTCEDFTPIYDPMKDWVMADENYPRKLQDEINKLNRRKLEIKDENRRHSNSVGNTKSKIYRRKHQTDKIQQHMEEALDERRYYRRREMTVRENYAKTEQDLARKKRELKDVASNFSSGKANSQRMLDLWNSMSEQLRGQIVKLEKKLDAMTKQISSLQKDKYLAQKNVHHLKGELEESVKVSQAVTHNMVTHEHGVKTTQEELRIIASRLDVLKRIREIKLHSDTVKRIYLYGYNPGGKLDLKDPLEEAFKLTAANIGKDWSALYQKLPFKPTRDHMSRVLDLEGIDIYSRRLDPDFSTLAMKSLDKWRRLSNYVSVNALVGALKRIKKNDVAMKIERQLMVED